MKKVLIISKTHTHPTTMGNSWGILAQAEALKKLGCEVHFLYIQERGLKTPIAEYEDILSQTAAYWGDKFHCHIMPKTEKIWRNIRQRYRKYICKGHVGLYDQYPHGIEKIVKTINEQYKFDICIVNYIFMTKLYDTIKFNQMACFTHDAYAYRNLMVKEDCYWMDAHQEATALQKCTDIFAVQDDELAYFHILSPNSRTYNIYSKYEYHPQTIVANKNIVFLSGNNGYNQNGLKWFIEEVFPLIHQKYPDAKLLIAGGICKVIKGIYDNIEGIELKGYVDDPKDFYALGDVAINPTYQGTGLKIKTFESIANDKVTMVHPHSMAGIYKKEQAPLFSSDKPQDWVDYLDSIWGHPDKIKEIKQKNMEYIEFLNEFIMSEYKRFLES